MASESMAFILLEVQTIRRAALGDVASRGEPSMATCVVVHVGCCRVLGPEMARVLGPGATGENEPRQEGYL